MNIVKKFSAIKSSTAFPMLKYSQIHTIDIHKVLYQYFGYFSVLFYLFYYIFHSPSVSKRSSKFWKKSANSANSGTNAE